MLKYIMPILTRHRIGERPATVLDNPITEWLSRSLTSGPKRFERTLLQRFLLWLGY